MLIFLVSAFPQHKTKIKFATINGETVHGIFADHKYFDLKWFNREL